MNKEISKEEAIKALKRHSLNKELCTDFIIEALTMAIEALEQKPSGEGGKSLDRSEIIDDIEQIQLSVDSIGLKGQNEYDLHLRENIADYILLHFQPPVISDEEIEIIASNQNSERDRNIFSEGMKAMRKLLTNKEY